MVRANAFWSSSLRPLVPFVVFEDDPMHTMSL